MNSVNFHVNGGKPIPLHVDADNQVGLSVGAESYMVITPEYDGEYVFTPDTNGITVPTNGYKMTHDFVVEPIPNNYGLITYDGSIITVS